MNDDFDFDGDNASESDGIKSLRKQAKELAKVNGELQSQLKEALAATRKASVSETLRDLGANPKLARYMPADVDASKESIEKWLADDGELFGFKPQGQEPAGEQQQSPVAPGARAVAPAGIPPAMVEAFSRVQNPESFGAPPTQGLDSQALEQMRSLAEQAGGSFHRFEDLQRHLSS